MTRVVLSDGDMTLTSARSWRDTRTAAFENVEDILFNIPTKPTQTSSLPKTPPGIAEVGLGFICCPHALQEC